MRRLGESIGKIAGGILGYTVVNAFLLFFTYCFISLFAQIGPIDIKLGVIAVTILSYIFLPAANIIINIIFNQATKFYGIAISKADIYPPASLAFMALCVYLSYYKETNPWKTLFLPEFTMLLLLYAASYLI